MAMNFTTTFTGSGRYPRALREMQHEIARLTPGRSPGVLTSVTTRGILRRPLGGRSRAGATTKTEPPRWS